MQELFEWLDRLELLASGALVSPTSQISERFKRMSSPSVIEFDKSVVRVVDAQKEAGSFGRVPARLSVLAWADHGSGGESLDDQALAAQLGAVLTLATNRRIQVAATDVTLTMEGTTNRTFLPSATILDRSLSGPLSGDAKTLFEEVLSSLYGLGDSDRDVIGAAIELHYAAALLFDVDPNAAYALCVGGIERLSRSYGTVRADWQSWEEADRLDHVFVELGLGESQMAKLREELLKDKHLRLRQTFAGYVTDSLADDFWTLTLEAFHPSIKMEPDGASSFLGMSEEDPTPIGNFVPSNRDVLRRRLLASYDARSSYVHDGRGRPSLGRTIGQIVGEPSGRTNPIEFAGMRAILRSLILKESGARGQPKRLPDVKAITPE